jgi:hypothetical protein
MDIIISGILYIAIIVGLFIQIAHAEKAKRPKIDRNVEWIPLRRSPCEQVFAGDMLSTLKGQSPSPMSDLAHRPISLN